MSSLFKKTSVLDKRLKRLQKELSSVSNDIRSLSRSVHRSGGIRTSGGKVSAVSAPAPTPTVEPERQRKVLSIGDSYVAKHNDAHRDKETRFIEKDSRKIVDERLADYLVGSLQAGLPLRHQRRIDRNRAIVMIIVVLVAFLWVLFRFFI